MRWCQRMGEQHRSGYTVSGSTVTLTLGTDVQPGDETQVSYQSSTATLKDVDEEEDGLDHGLTVATYAFDDELTLTSAKVTGTKTRRWNSARSCGWNECVCGVNEWCEQHREWVQ